MKSSYGKWFIFLVIIVLLALVFLMSGDQNKETNQDMLEGDVTATENMSSGSEDTPGDSLENIDTMMPHQDTTEEIVVTPTGSYENYSIEKVVSRGEDGDVVLFFKADWCPTCRVLDKDIRANLENIPADLSILTVDYDNSSVLKKQHGVTYQHTLVQVDKSGKLIKKWSGTMTLALLLKELEK